MAVSREVAVKPSAVHRMAKNHWICVDTGVEIIFPSEYTNNGQHIEFTNLLDRHIAITIKRVEYIENR